MARPPLLPSQAMVLERRDGSTLSPVEQAIRHALR
jgi:hypothetical protein